MARPLKAQKKPVIKIGEKKKRGQRTIKNEKLYHTHLVSAVRKRLKMSTKDLPAHVVQMYMGYIGKEICDWLVANPEGFRMPGEMGYLALSKYVLIPFREDRWEIVNKIKNLSPDAISDRFREIVLKKYGREMNKGDAMQFILRGKVAVVPMWFNHRNCNFRKGVCWKWLPSAYLKKEIKKSDKTKYYYFNFHDFYNHKIKVLDR